jgi:sulfur-carrier protein
VATVVLPRSLLTLFPGVERRHTLDGADVEEILSALDGAAPGMRDRLIEEGPRLRRHINVFVDGKPADLATRVPENATVHVIPAVSGGASWPFRERGEVRPLRLLERR